MVSGTFSCLYHLLYIPDTSRTQELAFAASVANRATQSVQTGPDTVDDVDMDDVSSEGGVRPHISYSGSFSNDPLGVGARYQTRPIPAYSCPDGRYIDSEYAARIGLLQP